MKKLLAILVALLLICANIFVPTASAWNVSGALLGFVNKTECTGDVLISPDGMNWGNEFSSADLSTVPVNSLPLAPASFNPVNKSFTRIDIDEELGAFIALPASLDSYIKYEFYAKLPYIIRESTEIQLYVNLASGVSFFYAAVDVDSNMHILNSRGNSSYVPVITSEGVIGVDANSNDIVDQSETAVSNLGPIVNVSTSTMIIPLSFTKTGEIKTITVYMWAEGQDPTCSGPIPAVSHSCISISIDAPSTNVNYGDINGDGNVSSVDALLALQASSGLFILNEEQFISADVNNSKSITSIDALAILQYSSGLLITL